MIRKLILFSLVLILAACASKRYTKQASKFEDAGLYEDAASYYYEAVKRKDSNVDAKLGLRKNGQLALDQKLQDFMEAYKQGNYEQAVYNYLDAEEYHRKVKTVGVNLNFPEVNKTYYEEAKLDFLNKKYIDGLDKLNREEFNAARRIFEEIRKVDPNYKDVSQKYIIARYEPEYRQANQYLENEQYRKAFYKYLEILAGTGSYKQSVSLKDEALEKATITIMITDFVASSRSNKETAGIVTSKLRGLLSTSRIPFIKVIDPSTLDAKIFNNGNLDMQAANLAGIKSVLTGIVTKTSLSQSKLKKTIKKGYIKEVIKITNDDGTVVNKNIYHKTEYSASGSYSVSLMCYFPETVDTIAKIIEIHTLPVVNLGNDTTVCHGYSLDISDYQYNFTWFDSSTNNFFIPDTNGVYWVEAQNEFGCTFIDSIELVIKPTPYFYLGNDTTVCENTEYILTPNNVYENSTYLWNDNSTDTAIIIDTIGTYWLQLINSVGCSYIDSIHIDMIEAPDVYLGNDTTINKTSSITLDAGYFGSQTYYIWEDNSTWQHHTVGGYFLDTGTYISHVRVTAPNGCIDSDTVNINIILSSSDDYEEVNPAVQFFPNPCSDYLIINNNQSTTKHIKVFNGLGELVLSKDLILKKQSIDISNLQRGLYLIEVYENNKILSNVKLVVE